MLTRAVRRTQHSKKKQSNPPRPHRKSRIEDKFKIKGYIGRNQRRLLTNGKGRKAVKPDRNS